MPPQVTVNQNPDAAIRNNDPFFTTGVVVFIIIGLVWAALWVIGSSRSEDLTQARNRIADLDAKFDLKENQEILNKYAAIQTVSSQMAGVRAKRFLFSPQWTQVKNSVSSDIQFSSVALGTDGSFRISGAAASLSSVAAFAQSLESQESISQVVPVTADRQGSTGRFTFTMTFKVVAPSSQARSSS